MTRQSKINSAGPKNPANPEADEIFQPEPPTDLKPADLDMACQHLAAALVEHSAHAPSDEYGPDDVTTKAAIIRTLNDAFRTRLSGGTLMLTAGIVDLGAPAQAAILRKVACFDAFEEANDPYAEHDFGAIEHEGERIFWKIDYYDLALDYGSEDPADPAITKRVLTIMLAEEY